MPKSHEALECLERLMKHTAPVVARYGWNLRELKEFYPNQAGLLGLNMNRSVICVRLRRADNKEHFLEWHDMLGTMVHELTHMKISAHSAEFYSFMDSLYTEVEKDEESGLIHRFDGSKGMAQGAGIPATGGKVLGGGGIGVAAKPKSRKDIANERALAAERRKKAQGIMGSGSVGTASSPGFSRKPRFDVSTREGRRQAMAWAADRRSTDNIACPAESQELSNDFDGGEGGGGQQEVVSGPKKAGSSRSGDTKRFHDLTGDSDTQKRKTENSSSSSSSSSSAPGARKRPKIIDLTETTPPNSQNDAPEKKRGGSSTSSGSSGAGGDSVEKVRAGESGGGRERGECGADADPYSRYSRWSCPICTFINPEIGATVACSMCSFRRHEDLPPANHSSSSSSSSAAAAAATGAGVGIPRGKEEDKEDAFDPYKAQMSSGHHAWRGGV